VMPPACAFTRSPFVSLHRAPGTIHLAETVAAANKSWQENVLKPILTIKTKQGVEKWPVKARMIYTLHAAWVFPAKAVPVGIHPSRQERTPQSSTRGAPERSSSSKLALLQVSGRHHTALLSRWRGSRNNTRWELRGYSRKAQALLQ
jgi:hypothetical protein